MSQHGLPSNSEVVIMIAIFVVICMVIGATIKGCAENHGYPVIRWEGISE
jgi:hypothetical protein